VSAEAQVQTLESLLARVQHNAALPRAKRAPVAPTPIEVSAPAPSFAEEAVTLPVPLVEAAAVHLEIEQTPAVALAPAAPVAPELEAIELTPEPAAAKPVSGEFAVAAEAPSLELVEISAAEERPEDEEIVDLDDLAVDEEELVAAEEVDSRRAVAAELADEAPALEVHETPTDVVSLEVHEDEEEHGPPESGRSLVAAPHESARVAVAVPTSPEPESLQAIELEEVRVPSVRPAAAPAIEAREEAAEARVPSVHPEAAPAIELEATFTPAIEAGGAREVEAPHVPSVRPEPTPAIEAHEAAAARAPSVRPEPTPAIELEPVRAPSVRPEPEPEAAPAPSAETHAAAPAEEISRAPSVRPESAPPTARPDAEALVELVAASAVEAATPEPIAAAPVAEPVAAVEIAATPTEPERIVTAVALSAPLAHARPIEGVTVTIEAAVLRPEVTPAEVVAFVGAVRDAGPATFGALLDAALDL
jgi:hypothetical protein